MKIKIDKQIVEFIPETPIEETELEALWVRMGNCVGDNKNLSPIGVYVPATGDKSARFCINGLTEAETNAPVVMVAPYDTDVYCVTCNKTVHVKKGEPIPMCCGKLMEILD
ncbi:MAG: hypothetical protein HUJ65_03355 [Oscillospiraceae bacterium]|nr:hypothetical protein [Oscillospiraceae bacterium]